MTIDGLARNSCQKTLGGFRNERPKILLKMNMEERLKTESLLKIYRKRSYTSAVHTV
jgi:hypothetical protein